MRRAVWTFGCLLLLLARPVTAAERVNVVAEQVRGVPTVEASTTTATLLVYVVDDAGDPIDEVEVEVLSGGRQVGSGRTDGRGRVLLSLSARGAVVVQASEAGFVGSVARGVLLRRGRLTAVVLPLEEAPLQPAAGEAGDEEPPSPLSPAAGKPGEPPGPAQPPAASPAAGSTPKAQR
jgi:hypothetical protein